jgi:hypothetical protein
MATDHKPLPIRVIPVENATLPDAADRLIEAVMVTKFGCEKIIEKSGSRLLPRLVYG